MFCKDFWTFLVDLKDPKMTPKMTAKTVKTLKFFRILTFSYNFCQIFDRFCNLECLKTFQRMNLVVQEAFKE